jgi:ubiquinone/menaquinone biosynthesis C-methylase UbiE
VEAGWDNSGARGEMKTVTKIGPNLEFTGERIVPGKTADSLFREHEERYVFAGQYVAGKDILDVACGTGVGTSFLREVGARSVRGIDIDPGAIAFASATYEDCHFAQGDATSLCLPDSSVDVVVSFETIEHVTDQRKFFLECRRVLRPGGMLVCSTPNRSISRWRADNPFHVRELFPSEFRDLLDSLFFPVELFAQNNISYLFYIIRVIALQALDRLRLRRTMKRILRAESEVKEFRMGFINDTQAMSGSIAAYRSSFLVQPTYLIAVAGKASK